MSIFGGSGGSGGPLAMTRTASAEADRTSQSVNSQNNTSDIADLDFSQKKIYLAQAKCITDALDDQIPPGLFDLSDPSINVVSVAIMMMEQMALTMAALRVESRGVQRNKIREEFNLQMKGIERKLAKDMEAVRVQYTMGTFDLKAAKKMMRLAKMQFATQVAAAVFKGIGEAFGTVMPGRAAIANVAGGILDAFAGLTSTSIGAIQLINQGTQSMLQSLVTKLNAEGSAIEHFYQASANMVGSERQMEEDFCRTMQGIFESLMNSASQLSSQQFMHLNGV